MPAPPWLMWGSTQTLNVLGPLAVGADVPTQSSQLAQISYGRPESWRFFFKATVTHVTGAVAAGTNYLLNFNLSFGVGRATTRIPAFCAMVFTDVQFVAGFSKSCASVELPKENAARVSNNIVEIFPAETIQLDVDGHFDNVAVILAGTTIEVVAFFAPEVHLRPEWHAGQFPGGEHKGH